MRNVHKRERESKKKYDTCHKYIQHIRAHGVGQERECSSELGTSLEFFFVFKQTSQGASGYSKTNLKTDLCPSVCLSAARRRPRAPRPDPFCSSFSPRCLLTKLGGGAIGSRGATP